MRIKNHYLETLLKNKHKGDIMKKLIVTSALFLILWALLYVPFCNAKSPNDKIGTNVPTIGYIHGVLSGRKNFPQRNKNYTTGCRRFYFNGCSDHRNTNNNKDANIRAVEW